jgi:hypothetical protein
MKSNNFVKKAAKLFGLVLAGSVLYYLAIELLSVLFKSKTGFKVSWGIATYYNYFLFFGVLCVSVLSIELFFCNWLIISTYLFFIQPEKRFKIAIFQ